MKNEDVVEAVPTGDAPTKVSVVAADRPMCGTTITMVTTGRQI